jgi:hypothetical protein
MEKIGEYKMENKATIELAERLNAERKLENVLFDVIKDDDGNITGYAPKWEFKPPFVEVKERIHFY